MTEHAVQVLANFVRPQGGGELGVGDSVGMEGQEGQDVELEPAQFERARSSAYVNERWPEDREPDELWAVPPDLIVGRFSLNRGCLRLAEFTKVLAGFVAGQVGTARLL